MQTLWSRVAQTRGSCRCSLCISRVTGVARRATTAAGRRLVRPPTSATFLYTSIFFAATVADQSVKQDRREQWEAAISQEKDALDRTRTGQGQTKLQQLEASQPSREEIDRIFGISGGQADRDTSGVPQQSTRATVADQSIQQDRREKREAAISQVKDAVDGSHIGQGQTKLQQLQASQPSKEEIDRMFGISGGQTDQDISTAPQQSTRANRSVDERAAPVDKVTLDERTPKLDYEGDDVEEDDWEQILSRDYGPNMVEARWPVALELPLTKARLPGNSIYQWPDRRQAAMTKQWTAMKRRVMEVSMRILVIELLIDAKFHGMTPEQAEVLPEPLRGFGTTGRLDLCAETKQLSKQIRVIANEDPWDTGDSDASFSQSLPMYHQDEHGTFFLECEQLNQALQALFKNRIHDQISYRDMIAGICNNLLVSPAPPNVNTFNVLAAGFVQLECHQPFHALVRSIRQTNMRPNEITCAYILKHYNRRNNFEGFVHFVDLMRGEYRGLMLAHPLIHIRAEHGEEYIGPLVYKRNPRRPEKIIQKVYPTEMVLREMLRGFLHFTDLATAKALYADLRNDGWPVSVGILSIFLKEATRLRLWEVGMEVWESMRRLGSWQLRGRRQEAVHRCLAELCEVCGMSDQLEEVLCMPIAELKSEKRFTYGQEDTVQDLMATQSYDSPHMGTSHDDWALPDEDSAQPIGPGSNAHETNLTSTPTHLPNQPKEPLNKSEHTDITLKSSKAVEIYVRPQEHNTAATEGVFGLTNAPLQSELPPA